MITGGIRSFGSVVLKHLIRIFSCDEKKQDDMRHKCQVNDPEVAHKIKFYFGDIHKMSFLKTAISRGENDFHAAELKPVLSCEFFPMEAIKTYEMGTDNPPSMLVLSARFVLVRIKRHTLLMQCESPRP